MRKDINQLLRQHPIPVHRRWCRTNNGTTIGFPAWSITLQQLPTGTTPTKATFKLKRGLLGLDLHFAVPTPARLTHTFNRRPFALRNIHHVVQFSSTISIVNTVSTSAYTYIFDEEEHQGVSFERKNIRKSYLRNLLTQFLITIREHIIRMREYLKRTESQDITSNNLKELSLNEVFRIQLLNKRSMTSKRVSSWSS